ncbi:MAG: hypothetical protein ABL870_12250 [Sediminibacterium sp.]
MSSLKYICFRFLILLIPVTGLNFLILMLSINAVYAEDNLILRPKAVLLISVKLSTESESISYYDSLEKTFLKRFSDSGFELKIIRKATIDQIRNELIDPTNTAIYLVAHSATYTIGTGITNSIVVDLNNYKLNAVLKNVSANLKFFALIGCESKLLLESYQKKYYAPDLQVFGFLNKIDARDSYFFTELGNGLSKAINESKKTLSELLSYEELSVLKDYCNEYSYDQLPNWNTAEINRCKERIVLNQPMIAKKALLDFANQVYTQKSGGSQNHQILIKSISTPNKYLIQIRAGNNVLGFIEPGEVMKLIYVGDSLFSSDQIVLELINYKDIAEHQLDFSDYSVQIDGKTMALLRNKNNIPIGVSMSIWK